MPQSRAKSVSFRDEPANSVAATEESAEESALVHISSHEPSFHNGSTATSSNEPLNFLNTAVATDLLESLRTRSSDLTSEEDPLSACESLVGTSVAGDSVVDSSDAEGNDKTATAAAARRQKRAAPKQQAL